MEDEKIIDLYWARSERAITETASKYGKYCHYIAFNILSNVEDSEECVNDTYLKTWESIPPRRPNFFSVFIGRITRNLSLNRLEYNRASKRCPGQVILPLEEFKECVPSQQNEIERIEDKDAIIKAFNTFLESLTTRDRKVFVCRYWYFCPIAEIAKAFDLSETNVKVILLRSRKKLKAILEKVGVVV